VTWVFSLIGWALVFFAALALVLLAGRIVAPGDDHERR
jgi:hypothetical protein